MISILYTKLDTELKEVRLVQLEPAAAHDDKLVGKLVKVSLLDKPQFRALSYVCGDAKDLKSMKLSDAEISIYKSVDRALRHVRSKDDTLTLWIDQLSIDQTDLDERAQQVRLMSDIYDVAVEVLVHLESDSDTLPEEQKYVDLVVETITTLGQLAKDEHYTGSLDLHGTWSELLRFFRNQYWFRIWTSQELILAKKVTFYYEKYPISDEIVDSFYSWYINHMGLGNCCQGDDHSNLANSAIDIATQAYATTRENRAAKRQGQGFDLLELLSNVRHRLTTIVHDKIFALAGLTSIPPEILDYKASVELTFERTTVHIIESRGTLDIFNHLSTNGPNHGSIRQDQASARNTSNDFDRLPKLASWSPDWSMYFKSREMKFLTDRLELISLYHAAGSSLATVKYTSPKLMVPGVRCGVIAKLHSCYERPQIFSSFLIQPWAKFVDVSLDDTMMSDGRFTSMKLRFIVGLTGGIGIRDNGAFILMKTREDYLRNEFLFMYWWQTRMQEQKEFTLFCAPDVIDVIKYYDEELMQEFSARYEYLVTRNCILRRFVVLEDGKFAFVPPTAMVGDLICVLKGGRTPFVLGIGRRRWTSQSGGRTGRFEERTSTLREEPGPEEAGCFQLLGDAYIEGLMESSVLTDAKEVEEFVLL